MKARYFLGALDWNRQEHTTRTPRSADDIDIVYSKRRGEFVVRAKARRERKEATSEVGKELMEKIIDASISGRDLAPMALPTDMHKRISKKERPDKAKMFETYHSRLSKS